MSAHDLKVLRWMNWLVVGTGCVNSIDFHCIKQKKPAWDPGRGGWDTCLWQSRYGGMGVPGMFTFEFPQPQLCPLQIFRG